ncbi:hypothetical protein FKP32DRAFT_1597268 [Trametes sanguinea]|nr:hypothetical protein FKP32DRAFT_1597268 [Trametes sanguinea]
MIVVQRLDDVAVYLAAGSSLVIPLADVLPWSIPVHLFVVDGSSDCLCQLKR